MGIEEEIHARLRSGEFTPSDLQRVIVALNSHDARFLDATVFQYVEHVESIDLDALIRYIESAPDEWHSYAVSSIISGLSYRSCDRADYLDQVLRFARGVGWDSQDGVQLSAVFALPRVTKCTTQVKSILKAAYGLGNPIVRDAALTSAQAYFGVSPNEILWGHGDEDMTDKMPRELLEWLAADTH